MKKVRFLSLVSFFGLVLIGFIFYSCEIGLGAAVDTQAPVVSFADTTVGTGGVIRDSFMVFGNWSDDGTIKEVTATLNRTDGTKFSVENKGKVEAAEDGTGTWNAVFDPSKENIPDGSYELSITMTDKGNHKTTITRAVIIDNTPPLVVLTRPGTKLNDTSFDSYGQKFSLEGKAADDNDVSLVEVNIFEDAACTKLLKTIPIPNVPLTIDLDVAEFSATELNDYAQIYQILKDGLADKKGGTAYRYCTLTIYDGAQRYPADGSAQTEADQKGNQTNTYYVNDDEIAKLFTEYKITELYHILNESFGSSAGRAISIDSVKAKLTQQAITSSQFSINPENSPTFVVNSRSPLEDGTTLQDAKYFITSGSSSLQVEISAGLDKHAILKDSVGIYLQECDINGVVSDSAEKIYLVEPVSEAKPNAHDDSIVEIVQSGTTYKFTTVETLTPVNFPLLQVTKYYKVFVEGKDVMTNDILPKDGQIFAFYLKPDTKFIEVSVTDVKPEWLSWTDGANAANKKYSARVTFSGGDATSYDVYRNGEKVASSIQSPFNDEITITSSVHPTEIVYKVKGKDAQGDENGAESSDYRVNPDRQYDNANPSVSSVVYPSKEDTENPTFQFSGNATDAASGVATVYLKISNTTGTTNSGDIAITWTDTHWEKNIKRSDYATGVFATEGVKKVEVWAVDKVGLKSSVISKTDWVYDTAAPTLNFTDPASITGGLITISGTASDGYGVKKVEVIQQKLGNNDTVVSTITRDATGTTSWASPDLPFKTSSASYTADEIIGDTHPADGKYRYTIKVTDNADKTTEKSVVVTLNTQAPDLEMDTDLDVWFASKNVSVSGTASAVSPATVSKVYYIINPTGTVTYPTATTVPSGWASAIGTTNWAVNLPADKVNDSPNNKLYLATVDNVGNVGKFGPYDIKVDSSVAELKPLYYNIEGTDIFRKAEGNIYVDGSKDLIVYGEYYDNQSGVNTLSFKLKNATFATKELKYSTNEIVENVDKDTLEGFTWGNFSSNVKYFKATFKASDFTESNVGDLKVFGSNGATASVDAKICSISFDNTKPELANVQFKSVDTKFNVYEESTGVYYVNKTKKFNITGVATDVGGGVDDVKLKIGSANPIPRDESENPNSWTFSNISLNGQTGNSVTLQLIVIDVAGNQKTYDYTFKFDQTTPEPMHWADAKGKDIYFRIGKADNDKTGNTWETGDTSNATNDPKNTDVGKKYAFGSWGNDSTIEIRGYFKEAGSGLKTIYYAIFNAVPTEAQITALENGTLTSSSDNVVVISSFAPITEETKKVPYNKTSGKTSKDVKTNFKTELTGFNADKNYLILAAEDNVGNRKADRLFVTEGTSATDGTNNGTSITGVDNTWNSAEPRETPTPYYIINKDMKVPNIESDIKQGLYTNGSNSVIITGTAYDADAGLSKITIEIKEQGIDYSDELVADTLTLKDITKDPAEDNPYVWSFTIPASKFSGLASTKSVTAYATAIDSAGIGNQKTISAATITKDSDAPDIEINIPSDADTSTSTVDVNGTISVSGTADDVYGINKVLGMCYKISTATTMTAPTNETSVPAGGWSAPSGWTKISTSLTDENATTNWTFQNINTANLSGSAAITNGSNVWFTVAVQDKAGNVGYAAPQKVIVNQNTDRPIVKFTNLANVGTTQSPQYILKYGTDSQLEGNISDDDATSSAVVNTFVVSSIQLTAAPTDGSDGWTQTTSNNDITWTHATYGTTKYNKTTGDYTYTPGVKTDGKKEVYFFVKDNKNKVFYTAHGTELNRPYQQHKQFDKTSNNDVISYKSDGTSPVINSIEIQPYTDDAVNGSPVTPGTSTVVGGELKNKIQFIIKAQDGNGIKSMSLEYTPAGGSATTIATSNSGSFTASTTNTETIWTTAVIPVDSIPTGSVNVAVTVNDQCELFANSNTVFLVDNDGPVINITSPKSTDEMTGKLSISGTTTDEGNAGADTIDFIIPTAAQTTAGNYASLADNLWGGNLHADASVSSFRYDFDGDTINENALLDVYTKDDTNDIWNLSPDNFGIYTVPFVFRSKDKLGNISVKEFSVTYNPDGDKPKTEITYPSAANYELNQDGTSKGYVTLGGEIRVTGSVSIPSLTTTPERVYLQIADTRQAFDATDKAKAGTGNGNYGYTTKTLNQVGNDIGKTIQGITGTAATNWWGIEAVRSSNAWSINLNSTGLMNPANTNTTNNIYIRACGVNAEGKMGSWSDPVFIHIDASAPQYTTKLYQFSGNPAVGSQTSEKDYEPGIYLKGQWYLGLHITDDDTVVIDSVKKGGTNGTPLTNSDLTEIKSNSNKTVDLFIKLDANASSTQTYTVSARDNANGGYHWIYPSYDINIDNNAPELTAVVSDEGYPISMTKQRTSNKVITFGSTATDTGSGFSRLAYYFKRGTGNTATVELPMPAASDAANNKWTTGTAYKSGAVSGLSSDSDLYGVSLDGTKGTSGNDTTFTITAGIGTNTFIRKGGIVKMAGTYHRIKAVSESIVTVEGIIDATVTSAFFPIAFIVDNTSSEGSEWENGINTMKGDDGDGVVESVKKAGATWTWDTSIYAGELDDGEITLVCVAFDVAENAAKSETKFMLTNKTPRVSKLYLATDLNGNGSYSADEFGTSVITSSGSKTVESYYSALNSGNLQDVFTVYGNIDDENNSTTSSGITMRDKLGMAFEFVSGYEGYGAGQGALKYKLTIGSDKIQTGETGITGNLTNDAISNGLMGFEVPTSAVSTGTEDALNYLHVTLWDNANGRAGTKDGAKTQNEYTTQSGDTAIYDTYASFGAQWTAFNVPIMLDLVDGDDPTVTINNPQAVTHTEGTGNAEHTVIDGHVDLHGDLPSTLTGSNEFDRDDKVSGKIKFTGTINDEKRIVNIILKVSKGENAINFSTKPITDVTLATYSTGTGTFDNTTITPNGATGVTFTITSSTFSTSTGHTVAWELEVDTEKVAGNAAADVLFTLTANDGTNNGNATQQVDIVPYITSLERPDAKTSTHRSRRGKYQVVLGEDLKITGFNLPGTEANAIKLQTAANYKTANNNFSAQITAATGSTIHDMTFTAPASSGYLKVVTNSVSSVNNFNSGNSVDSGYDLDEWTDDVYLSVWKNDEYFAFSNDPISPSMDRYKYAAGNDKRYTLYGGWATQGGKFFASYPNVTDKTGTGNAPSPASGRYGVQNNTSNLDSENFNDPATFYDVAVNGQERYNVLVDCWQGSTRGWGRNFVINKNGNYAHNSNGNTPNDNSNADSMINVIERMGMGGRSPEEADSRDGLDEIFNQFLNPRIVYYDGKAFITYYDRYAKCLKWAVAGDFTGTRTANNANLTLLPKTKYATEGKRTEGSFTGSTFSDSYASNGTPTVSSYYTNGGLVVAGYDTTVTGGTTSTLNSGLWSDIAIDTEKGLPVIAYYETTGSTKHLMVATGYIDTNHSADTTYPINKDGTSAPVITSTSTPTAQGSAWKRQEVSNSANLKLGEYVSIALDGDNNIHIACKCAKDGALYYVYGEKGTTYGDDYTWTTVCIDNNGSPGTWTDIKLTDPSASGAAAGPVISYYDPTNDSTEDAIKVAYFEAPAGTSENPHLVPANWDTMTVPCNSVVETNRITLALDVTDGESIAGQATTSNNSKLAIGYVSNRFDCVYLRKE
ncbi:MAG: hypothetical protein J5726_00650 [Treponema sp.]|nr:hypothetical protein [Treponema sp.]